MEPRSVRRVPPRPPALSIEANGCGTPLWANPQAQAVTPTSVLLLVMPEAWASAAAAAAVFFFAVLAVARPPLREAGKRVALAAAAVLLGIGITAAYLVPAAFAVAQGERSRMAELATPSPPGHFSPRDFVRPPLYWQTALLGGSGGPGKSAGRRQVRCVFLRRPHQRIRRGPGPRARARDALLGPPSRELTACRVAIGALVLYLLWYPPLRALLERTPGLRELALRLTTNRAAGILILLLALLAARQLDRLREGGGRASARVGVVLALAAAAVVGAEFLSSEGRPASNAVRAVSFLLPLGVLLLLLLLLLVRDTPGSRRAIVALALVGTAVDLLRIGVRFNPGTRPEHYFPETPEVRELQTSSRGGRYVAAEGILTGVAYQHGLEDVRSHDPVALAAYSEALAVTAGYTWTEYAARVTRLDAPILPALNLRAVLPADGNVRATSGLAAYFPERLVGERDPATVLAAMAATGADADFTRTAFAVGESAAFAGAAEVQWWKRVRPEKILVRVRTASPRLLVLAESNDGGWAAESDGTKLPTLVVEHALLGVRVPAGERTVVVRYVPPGLSEGAVISAISLAIVAALGIAGVRSRGRKSGPGPTAAPGRSPAR